jgi:hypothetical protein
MFLVERERLFDDDQPLLVYRKDTAQTIVPIVDILNGKPLLMQYGDHEPSQLFPVSRYDPCRKPLSPALPHIKKFRSVLAEGELERITSAKCYGANRPMPRAIWGERLQPILWKLNTQRHWESLHHVADADKPWHEKKAKAIFRGELTGLNHISECVREKLRTDQEICNAADRCRIVLMYHNSALIDARLTKIFNNVVNSTMSGIGLLAPQMEMKELLDYKVIILLEGNDVSSGLKWILLSNSVVMMPPPTFTSWAMEELLEPWVHYIPLDPSLTDAEEKMRWVLDHDKEAQQIAHRGSLWMKDLVEHPAAEEEDREINRRILQRYQRHFQLSVGLVDGKSS